MGETLAPVQKADEPSKPIFGVEKRSPGEMALQIGQIEHILSCEDAALLGEILTGMANKHLSDRGARKTRKKA